MRLRRTPSPDAKLEFLDFHQPKLEAGKYEVFIEQKVKNAKIPESTYAKKLTFAVTGERFGPLPPQDVLAVFPPRDSVGDHSHALPHVTLRRSTLPWERFPGQTDENRTWMALLLLRDSDFETEADKPRLQSLKLSELLATPALTVRFPSLSLEWGQQPTDEVTVLDVKRKVLEPLLPKAEELALLAHVHQSKSSKGVLEGAPEATVLCNRLPMPDGNSTVHLVSLENRYTNGEFNFQGADPDDWVRLVSLTHWSFFSVDPEQSFSALLRRLDRMPSTLRLPLSVPPESPAAPYLEQGYVPVPHRMRRGSKSVSFYRGPLVPGENPDTVSLPVRCADELLRYDPATGLLDVSYASAWELGRLLTLANTRVALELFHWKRRTGQQQRALRQRAGTARRLPLRGSPRTEEPAMPDAVSQWLEDLALLKGLPFSYLIPDERMLPAEGLRLFRVDPVWVDCLLDGAHSVGRVTEADWQEDVASRARRSLGEVPREISGFLMRSTVVSGYPGLLVEAYEQREDVGSIPAEGMNALRVDRLADDVLLGLFKGELKTVDFFQAPEGLSFGLDVPTGTPPVYTKNLRDRSGQGTELLINPVPFHHTDKGVVDMKGLAELMKSKTQASVFTAAQYALQMIEGGPRIRFVASK